MRYLLYSNKNNPLLDINQIGYSKSPKITRFGPAKREFYIIHYVLSGKGYFNSFPVTGGQGFLITPGMAENYCPDKNDPWEFLWILSGDNIMRNFFDFYDYDTKTNIFNYNSLETIRKIANYIIENNGKVLSASEILEIYLRIFNSHASRNRTSISSNADMYFNFSVDYIASNIHEGVTVETLTMRLGISQPYLYKIFMKKTGKSPKKYIDEYKLKQAKKMLSDKDFSIADIAENLGYSDYNTFSKFFKSAIGVSPSKYRHKLQAVIQED